MVSERLSLDGLLDSPNAFQHVVDAEQKGCVLALEDPGGLRLDLLSDQRVQSVPLHGPVAFVWRRMLAYNCNRIFQD
jgi:hypothetical protein